MKINNFPSIALPGVLEDEVLKKIFNEDRDVPPPHLSSSYFKTLTQLEKEQAWKAWADKCYKYVKEREEADQLYEELIDKMLRKCVNKYVEGDVNYEFRRNEEKGMDQV